MSCSGTLKKFMEGKGFGFIENSDGSGDVFVHFSQVTNGGSEDMIEGTEMTFDIEQDQRSGKTKATNVTLGSGGGGGGGGSYGGGDSYGDYGGKSSGKGKGKGGKGKDKGYSPY
mmetsp:Transcript_3728/g.6583  ORF Transcript_3728/g.6583 Transcript_3728/m.6583 type:complete len:114 (-) Transcript_3728:122-463(-)|eukprot:CAMPEP_0197623556 /NCGR_PEP_ID=MMETSP1338-20131121/3551_1 /TAXON_ID=43686 ORGANISM="Pelagodinium beii, Strain RCC1491" /NCGR_SAMPLE_ID=MMETSP1338 /ASSEMBLY_ACC=CAM_ASM_000754 /LENGTH=113 /DNA_ID=CAMNT_0043193571 /DNA_START=66 /DNA_END=407 /DNA_ORIENTATION=-